MPTHIDLPQTIVIPDIPDQPQQTEIIIPGYYYSNVPLNSGNLDKRGSYIGTELNGAKPTFEKRFIYYIVGTQATLIATFFMPKRGCVYIASSELTSIGNATLQNGIAQIPAGKLCLFVCGDTANDVGSDAILSNAFCPVHSTTTIDADATSVDQYSVIHYNSNDVNKALHDALTSVSAETDSEGSNAPGKAKNIWPVADSDGNYNSSDKPLVESFNNICKDYSYLWEIPVGCWKNTNETWDVGGTVDSIPRRYRIFWSGDRRNWKLTKLGASRAEYVQSGSIRLNSLNLDTDGTNIGGFKIASRNSLAVNSIGVDINSSPIKDPRLLHWVKGDGMPVFYKNLYDKLGSDKWKNYCGWMGQEDGKVKYNPSEVKAGATDADFEFYQPYISIAHPGTWFNKSLVQLWLRYLISVYISSTEEGDPVNNKYSIGAGWSTSYASGGFQGTHYGVLNFGFNSSTTQLGNTYGNTYSENANRVVWPLGTLNMLIQGPASPVGVNNSVSASYIIQCAVTMNVGDLYENDDQLKALVYQFRHTAGDSFQYPDKVVPNIFIRSLAATITKVGEPDQIWKVTYNYDKNNPDNSVWAVKEPSGTEVGWYVKHSTYPNGYQELTPITASTNIHGPSGGPFVEFGTLLNTVD